MSPQEFIDKYSKGNTAFKNPGFSDLAYKNFTSSPTVPDTTKDFSTTPTTSTTPIAPTDSISPVSAPVSQGLGPINLNTANMLQSNDKGQYKGLCQRFVEDATYGKHGIYDSAISAWKQLPNKVEGSLQGVKPGDLVYFSPNKGNEGDGHVGIYEGNGVFKSATSEGIQDYNIADWAKKTGQSVLGYVPTG